eukprot:m.505360 g.505360  ORF g.505360 m.505360 type:complete len:61 (-) comp305401_c0_seq1:59-241(-)
MLFVVGLLFLASSVFFCFCFFDFVFFLSVVSFFYFFVFSGWLFIAPLYVLCGGFVILFCV